MKGEADFIAALRGLASHPAARGLQDDAAVLKVGGETLVLTHDVMVEGVHFLSGQDLADVAWKLVAVNLSDLAAKGAQPLGVLLGYMLSEGDAAFLSGLQDVLSNYGVPLLGGDTVSGGPPLTYGLTAVGRADFTPVPGRSGASAGEDIYITGPLGAAMAGFEALKDGADGDSTAYRRPMARLAEGSALAPLVGAMMDISDGLLLDASRMADASGVTLAIDSASIPLAVGAEARERALRWGDDYELLFTAKPGTALPVTAWKIGTVQARAAPPLLVDGEVPHGNLGYQHG